MPNHVTTLCTITGPNDDVSRFQETMIRTMNDGQDERRTLDFNAAIPMPEILRDSEASGHAEIGAALIIYRAGRGAPFADHAEIWSKHIREALMMPRSPIREVATAYLSQHPDIEQAGMARLPHDEKRSLHVHGRSAIGAPSGIATASRNCPRTRSSSDSIQRGTFQRRCSNPWRRCSQPSRWSAYALTRDGTLLEKASSG